jgi:hypothetical protein
VESVGSQTRQRFKESPSSLRFSPDPGPGRRRLACSPHGDEFVLKGAMLFALWTGKPHRATWDLSPWPTFPRLPGSTLRHPHVRRGEEALQANAREGLMGRSRRLVVHDDILGSVFLFFVPPLLSWLSNIAGILTAVAHPEQRVYNCQEELEFVI